jgi:hypothetical protein
MSLSFRRFKIHSKLQESAQKLDNLAVFRYEDFMNQFDDYLSWIEDVVGLEKVRQPCRSIAKGVRICARKAGTVTVGGDGGNKFLEQQHVWFAGRPCSLQVEGT